MFRALIRSVALALFCLLLAASPALADFAASRAWFDGLDTATRSEIQTDLLLAGHYSSIIDGSFSSDTFEAITEFQRSEGGTATGVLSASESARLDAVADEVSAEWGMEPLADEAGHVALVVPTRLLTGRQETDAGTSYFSEDAEISLETMHLPLDTVSFDDLYAELVGPHPERRVSQGTYEEDRFIVSGEIGDYSYYTLFKRAGDEAVGYSLAWGAEYKREGEILSTFLAAHFIPFSELFPPTADVPSAKRRI